MSTVVVVHSGKVVVVVYSSNIVLSFAKQYFESCTKRKTAGLTGFDLTPKIPNFVHLLCLVVTCNNVCQSFALPGTLGSHNYLLQL